MPRTGRPITEPRKYILPHPPSVNTYWRRSALGGKPRTHISNAGRKYRKAIAELAMVHGYPRHEGPLYVSVDLFVPDRRKRDIDNGLKSIFDSLEHAGFVEDDAQIKRLSVLHCGVDREQPRAEVTISPLTTEPST